jgi:nicotinamidase-related amidase
MHSLYARMLFICFVAAMTITSRSALAQRVTKPKTLNYAAPPLSFFEDCVFVCVDIQEGGEGPVTSIPEGWEKIGYTIDDCQAAADFLCKVAKPNARQVADACRALELPVIFIHWGCLFEDGMDLDPRIRRGWAEDKTVKLENVVPHISKPSSQPDKCLGIRDGEYVLAKSAQDAFPSCNISYVLENLEAKNIVFVGGHTNPGGCLGQTAKSARERGYTILCIEDATFDAGESTRIPGIAAVPFHYVMRTREFVKLAKEAQATQFLKP